MIYRGDSGTFRQVSDVIASGTGPSMQMIDVNGDGKDDRVLASCLAKVQGDSKPDLVRLDGTSVKVRAAQ